MSVKARTLRKNSTEAEKRLWAALRSRRFNGYKFRRQRPIGCYIADFVCMEHKLIIEADGGQHADSAHDSERDVWLKGEGWRILRFWNNDVLANMEGVLTGILRELGEEDPHPPIADAMGPPLSR
jgi:very-short-patch-repair endonuclease